LASGFDVSTVFAFQGFGQSLYQQLGSGYRRQPDAPDLIASPVDTLLGASKAIVV
jgi:hypothetical protein